MIVIDGVSYNIPVVSIKRRADFLDKVAERTEDGTLHREIIGVYFNYQLQLAAGNDPAEYAALWLKLTEPVTFHMVTVPDTDGSDITFSAYFSNVGDEVRRIRGSEIFWKGLTVNFTAQSPARTP